MQEQRYIRKINDLPLVLFLRSQSELNKKCCYLKVTASNISVLMFLFPEISFFPGFLKTGIDAFPVDISDTCGRYP
jgi:hypothetical protein